MEKILISKCLMGANVRFDGKNNLCQHPCIDLWLKEGRLIYVCPEVMGGLGTPRDPAAIVGPGGGEAVLKKMAQVKTKQGVDVTEAYISGAQAALALATQHNIKMAILKERSPSCGGTAIYTGRFDGERIAGEGVTASLLRQNGIKIFNETQVDLVAQYLNLLEKI